jgi:glutamine---fructose-6-phosphate transaminase (isomerizing)
VAGGVAVVHNGIIENLSELRTALKVSGVRFATDTDTEVIVHLVGAQLKKGYGPIALIDKNLPVHRVIRHSKKPCRTCRR